MKNIRESLGSVERLSDFLADRTTGQQVDEGFKDILNNLKQKFKQVWKYVTGFVVKLTGSYWCPCDDEGNVLNAISPFTAGQAYKDGEIDKSSTLVSLDKDGAKATGCRTKPKDAAKLYGSGNSIAYWSDLVNESVGSHQIANINEIKLGTEDAGVRHNILDTPDLMKVIEDGFKFKGLPTLLIWGAPGIGKTAILMNVLKSIPGGEDMNLIAKTLSNETPDNFFLPTYVETNGQKKATDVPKTWLPVYKPTGDPARDQELDDGCGKGLLFFDELSRTSPQVLNVVLPLINEREFNGWKVGSGWEIIAASNRPWQDSWGSETQTDIGGALSNRVRQVYYEPTAKSWSEWAKTQNYISPLLIQWLNLGNENMSGAEFFYMDPNETLQEEGKSTQLMCTPRSWTNAMRNLAVFADTGKLEGFTIFDIYRKSPMILKMTLNQYVPADAVDTFVAFLEVVSKVGDFDKVVNSVWKNAGKGFKISRKDLHLISLPLAQLIITSHIDALPDEKEFTNLCQWLVDQNSDQLASYVLDILQEVYGGMLTDKVRNGLFVLRAKYEKELKNDASMTKTYETIYKSFLSKWGVDLETMPDWYPGFKLLVAKYKDAFSIEIDGVSALG